MVYNDICDTMHEISDIRDKYSRFGREKEREKYRICSYAVFMLNIIVEETEYCPFCPLSYKNKIIKFFKRNKTKFLLTFNIKKYKACKNVIYIIEKYC